MTDLPEGAVEALAKAHYEGEREGHMPPWDEVKPGPNGGDSRAGYRAEAARYADAVPAIRKQERERVMEQFFVALDREVRKRQIDLESEGTPTVFLSDVHAALATLEDSE